MEVRNRDRDAEPFTTKDGSTIRELLRATVPARRHVPGLVRATAAFAVLGALTVVLAASAGTPKTVTTGVAGSVDGIAVDGGLVAIASRYEGGGTVCDRVGVWNPTKGTSLRLAGKDGGCRKVGAGSDDGVVGLGFAGGRAVWAEYDYGNHAYCSDVWTATVSKPTPVTVGAAPCTGALGGTTGESFAYGGSGSFFAVLSFTYCDVVECQDESGSDLPAGGYDPVLWRLSGTKLTKLKALADRTVLLDADATRVVVRSAKGAVSVLDTKGAVKAELAFGKGEALAARLAGSRLVVHVAKALRLVEPSGKVVRTFNVPAGASLTGATATLAAYVSAGVVHVVRLSDGRDRTVGSARGFVAARLTSAGLAYAWNVPGGGAKPGRVAWVTAAELGRALG